MYGLRITGLHGSLGQMLFVDVALARTAVKSLESAMNEKVPRVRLYDEAGRETVFLTGAIASYEMVDLRLEAERMHALGQLIASVAPQPPPGMTPASPLRQFDGYVGAQEERGAVMFSA